MRSASEELRQEIKNADVRISVVAAADRLCAINEDLLAALRAIVRGRRITPERRAAVVVARAAIRRATGE